MEGVFGRVCSTEFVNKIIHESALHLGYSLVKPKQEEAVRAFVQQRDVFISVPTEFGKSLCYSLLLQVLDRQAKEHTHFCQNNANTSLLVVCMLCRYCLKCRIVEKCIHACNDSIANFFKSLLNCSLRNTSLP